MDSVIKLKHAEIKPYRDKLVKSNPVCCLCCKPYEGAKKPVLDHSHVTGLVRDAICSNCNSMLGKCENAAIRAAGKVNLLQWLNNMISYVTYHSENPSSYMHPTHGKIKKRKKKYSVVSA